MEMRQYAVPERTIIFILDLADLAPPSSLIDSSETIWLANPLYQISYTTCTVTAVQYEYHTISYDIIGDRIGTW